ncbi:MAG: uncharacterized protein V7642_6136 [Burkholderiales bacterium]|jgi:uncharacterized OB-fold protein
MNSVHDQLRDWTVAQEGIVYQACPSCASRWYFQRRFCPRCGATQPTSLQASGRGTVYSVATVHRAPSEEMRPYAPYTIVLIDMDEGFRIMGHGTPDLRIGEAVRAGYRSIAGKLMPYFDRDQK